MQPEHVLIKYNFNKAATTYLNSAHMQQNVAISLAKLIPQYHRSGLILDLGSGPGTFSHIQTHEYQLLNYDLSLNMLKTGAQALAVNGNAMKLPFAAACFKTIISNLMLQWPHAKDKVFSEIVRVLDAEGKILFTTLINNSLWQLKKSWEKVDMTKHVLEFLSKEDYFQLCEQAGLEIIYSKTWLDTIYFADIHDLFQHFKSTGTVMPKSMARNGLGGRDSLDGLKHAYTAYMTKQGLPLSYHYLLIIAQKPAPRRCGFI